MKEGKVRLANNMDWKCREWRDGVKCFEDIAKKPGSTTGVKN